MQTHLLPTRLLAPLLLLSVLLVNASAAHYGEACTSDVDCESKQDKSAHCYIFAVDQTPLNALSSTNLPEPQLPRVFGKCEVRHPDD
ncbi:hypothetical protein T484DRAFT_1772303 [Baffinella frigidus]|nr:hypothetical protein T484DRAFT_1772303 [Cryptophyta sp. CCMP2293]